MTKTTKTSMAELNLMSLAELKALENKVQKAIVKFEEREKKKAFATLKSQARKLGLSLAEIAELADQPESESKPRGKVPPKYANPNDSSQTWTGRGRRPAWVNEAMDAGKSLDDLLI